MFAAASLKNALDDANAAFTKATGVKVVASYAASSALAKQIEQGAPADVFISADLQWMDYAAEHKLIKPDTRVNLLGNRLVLIAPKDSKLDKVDDRPRLRHRQARRRRPHRGRRREGGAGRALCQGGAGEARRLDGGGAEARAWPRTCARRSPSSRAARPPIGIVYETDAKIEPKVKIVGVFPDGSYPPVTYPVAATATARTRPSRAISTSCARSAAKAIFEKYGFSFLIKPVS